MKKTLFFLSLFIPGFIYSQLIEENFDSYDAGDYVGTASEYILPWSEQNEGPDDIRIQDSLVLSEPNALTLLAIEPLGGPADIIVPLDYNDQMGYDINFAIYVVEGASAYYNFQEDVTPGIDWAYDVFFNADGTVDISQDQVPSGQFTTYSQGTWIQVNNKIDLLNQVAKVSLDGQEVFSVPYFFPIGSVNFYPIGGDHFVIDDISVTQFTPVGVHEAHLEVSIYPNPADDFIQISGVSAGTEITLTDLLGKELVHYSQTSETSRIDLSEYTTGIYLLEAQYQGESTVRKIQVR